MVGSGGAVEPAARGSLRHELIVVLFAAFVFLGNSVSPPSLMDDVDAVQAQIARNMIESGDWVTARLNGVAYLEKAPLPYWMMAVSYLVLGPSDQAARLPFALSAMLLCWLVARMGAWAFSPEAGLYAGLALATAAGPFLFTRILIPDVALTLTTTLAMWALLRSWEDGRRSWRWPLLFWASLGVGFLLKGLIAMILPAGAGLVYLAIRRKLLDAGVWRALRPAAGLAVCLAIAAPWPVLATLRNPPWFDFTLRSEPGQYRGFFWFFFLNEHLFRFLDMRHPRDYNTVPRLWFWLLHLLWLFPWSAYFPAAARLRFRPADRAGAMHLLASCWTGFVLVFFTFSTTQEYYSMPCYPALALLVGSALAAGGAWIRGLTQIVAGVAASAALLLAGILWMVRGLEAPGDIARALTLNTEAYTFSLGHLRDLTLGAFAYLRRPALAAAVALAGGAIGAWRLRDRRAVLALAVMMALVTHAARFAMLAFDPYLSSRPLAEALKQAPLGGVIFDNQYYTFSSVFFYARTSGFLLNGRVNNLEYGSWAPGAPDVFLDDAGFARLWRLPERYYLLAEGPAVPRLKKLGGGSWHVVAASGGKFLISNHPAPG